MTKHLIGRQAAGRRRRPSTIDRDIAQYRSPADLLEISEILDRYPDSETIELRQAVDRQLRPAAG